MDEPTYEELAAHVERLRDFLNELVMWNRHGAAGAIELLKETPAQSLTHIQAQVEEETIERCADNIRKTYTLWVHGEKYTVTNRLAIDDVLATPRKYAKEVSDESI